MTKNAVIPWWRVQFSESDAKSAADAVRGEHLSLGPVTAAFEEELGKLLNVPYVVATTSGSMALLMALMALDIGGEDEVIVPNRTWIAAAHAAQILGAKPVFVDVCSDIPNINCALIEEKINIKTKAIIPTPLNGRAVNMKFINDIAAKHKINVIEDAAQALFSRIEDNFMGTESLLGCYSLSMAKLIPTGQGGFVVTRDKLLYQKLRKIRTHGVDDLLSCHFMQLGFNFRYTDLQASIGLAQLKKLEQKITSLKQIYQLYEKYLKNCKNISLIPVDVAKGELPLYIEILCNHRDQLIEFLKENQVQSKGFYPNLNRASYFGSNENFVNANIFESNGLTLPGGPDQSIQNIEKVIEILLAFDNQTCASEVA